MMLRQLFPGEVAKWTSLPGGAGRLQEKHDKMVQEEEEEEELEGVGRRFSWCICQSTILWLRRLRSHVYQKDREGFDHRSTDTAVRLPLMSHAE